jgi:RimJ/RimL family protein N-acetyltransferase
MAPPGTVAREVLATERLELEPVEARHAQGLWEGAVDSRRALLPWMPWARETSLEANQSFTAGEVEEWRAGRRFTFAMVSRERRRTLGVIGLVPDQPGTAELHYWIRTDHSGRGLATEAGRAVLGWARSRLGLQRVTLWAGRDNAASRRVAVKLGFVHLGPLDWRPEGGLGTFEAERYELRLDA